MASPTNSHEQIAKTVCSARGLTYVGEVGAGAFKQTFHVKKQDEDLALKLIVRGSDQARIEREIAALKKCNHYNICRLYESGLVEDSGNKVAYLIEEYLAGGTLSDRLRNNLLPPSEIKHLAIHLINAITHLADHRITHRDIKPDNIMFRSDGTPVLVDLGIARHLEESSLTKTFMLQGPGTPLFASPEQLVNDKHLIDWRSDQFSLGVTLSYASTGIHPFEENNSQLHTIERVASRKPATEKFLRLARGLGLDPLIKMVEVWPVKRFARTDQLLAAWQS